MKIKYYLFLIMTTTVLLFCTGCNANENDDEYSKQVIENIEQTTESEIPLLSLTPFEWEEAYIFKPYTSKEGVEEVLNCKAVGYKNTVSDSDTLIYFLKDDTIVSCIAGNVEELNFYLDYSFDDYYCELSNDDMIQLETINNKKCISVAQ